MRARRVFLDTNVLLDIFDADRPGHDDAVRLVEASSGRGGFRMISAISSFKDVYYVLTRLYKDEPCARRVVAGLMDIVAPVDMLGDYGAEAIKVDEPDFEDALIRVCAEHEGSDVIVTRDAKAFAGSAVPALSAGELLDALA